MKTRLVKVDNLGKCYTDGMLSSENVTRIHPCNSENITYLTRKMSHTFDIILHTYPPNLGKCYTLLINNKLVFNLLLTVLLPVVFYYLIKKRYRKKLLNDLRF
jgi:hypothetical protein